MRAPFAWVGGKHYLIKHHLPLFPEHTTYIEPFGGGASLLFAKEPSKIEVYNDVDKNLVNFFRVIRDENKRKKLIHLLMLTPYSRAEFNENKTLYLSETFSSLGSIERAYIFFYLIQTCWGSKMNNPTFGYTFQRNYPRKFFNAIKEFDKIGERIQNVYIECIDFRKIFNVYDSEHSFFYVDPPYIYEGNKKYNCELTLNDHRDLLRMINNLKGKVMICNFDNSLYNDKLSSWKKVEFARRDTLENIEEMKKMKIVKEYVWVNYSIKEEVKEAIK